MLHLDGVGRRDGGNLLRLRLFSPLHETERCEQARGNDEGKTHDAASTATIVPAAAAD